MSMHNKPQSYEYQHLFYEIPYDPYLLIELFDNENNDDEITSKSDYIKDLEIQLLNEYFRLAKEKLTNNQYNVMILLIKGHSQTEIAKIIGIRHQPAIHKIIYGQRDYRAGITDTKHGGLIKRLQEEALKDPVIMDLVEQIYYA